MNREQVMQAFEASGGKPILVRNRKSGTHYILELDVVQFSEDKEPGYPFVYGTYCGVKPGRRGTYRWFSLFWVDLVA